MSELLSNAKSTAWEWRAAILWFLLFSLNSLGTVLLAVLTGVQWSTLSSQSKFMIGIAVWVNWSGTVMAFVSKQAARIKQTGEVFPAGDTQFIPKVIPIEQMLSSAERQLAKPSTISPAIKSEENQDKQQ